MSEAQPHSFRQPERRRRSSRAGAHVPTSFAVYDWIGLLLTGSMALGGIFYYGAVTLPAFSLFCLLSWIGFILFLVRPVCLRTPGLLLAPSGIIFFASFGIYAAIRAPFSAVHYEAWMEVIKAAAALTVFLGMFNFLQVRKRGQALLGLLFFLVSILCWYAIIQAANGSAMVLSTPRPEQYGMRASSTYICPNHFAHLLVMLLPFALGAVFISSKKKLSNVIGAYALLLFIPVLFMTLSRSGWIGATAGCMLTWLLIAWKRNRRTFFISLAVIPILGGMAFAALWLFSPAFQERISGAFLGAHDDAVAARLRLWHDTLPMIKDALFFGHGNGAYVWTYPRYQSHTMQYYVDFAHNEVLQFLAEYGIVGFLLFSTGLGLVVVQTARAYRNMPFNRNVCLAAALFGSLLGSLLHCLFDFNLHIHANLHIQIILVCITLASLSQSEVVRPRVLDGLPAVLLRVLAGLLATGMLLHTARIYFSDLGIRQGEEIEKTFNYEKALERYRQAAIIYPGHYLPHLKMADALRAQSIFTLGDPQFRQQKAQEALEAYERAVEENPINLDANLGLSLAYLSVGQEEAASARFDQVMEFAHHNIFFLQNAARQYSRMGQREKALKLIDQANEISPGNPESSRIRQYILKTSGRN